MQSVRACVRACVRPSHFLLSSYNSLRNSTDTKLSCACPEGVLWQCIAFGPNWANMARVRLYWTKNARYHVSTKTNNSTVTKFYIHNILLRSRSPIDFGSIWAILAIMHIGPKIGPKFFSPISLCHSVIRRHWGTAYTKNSFWPKLGQYGRSEASHVSPPFTLLCSTNSSHSNCRGTNFLCGGPLECLHNI